MGKILIIKGADFSENAVASLSRKINELYYNNQDSYEIYRGEPNPIKANNGLIIQGTTFATNPNLYRFAHFQKSLVTDIIDVGDYTNFRVHGIFNLNTSNYKVYGILFLGNDSKVLKYYSIYTNDTTLPEYIDSLPTSNEWHTIEGDIPEGAKYIIVGCVGINADNYQNFELELNMGQFEQH